MISIKVLFKASIRLPNNSSQCTEQVLQIYDEKTFYYW